MRFRRRVYAYITHRQRLLVFAHRDYPAAGIQVPAGTIEPGEAPAAAALREAHEETGLTGLTLGRFLGSMTQDMREFGVREIQEAHFYHLLLPEAARPPGRWLHTETDGGQKAASAGYVFVCYWVDFPAAVPSLAGLCGAYLAKLAVGSAE